MESFVSRRELSPSSTHSTVVAQTVVLNDRPWAQLGSSVYTSITPALARRLEFASLCPKAPTASLCFPFRDSFLILLIMTPQSSLTGTPFKQHPSSVTWSVMANPSPCMPLSFPPLPFLSCLLLRGPRILASSSEQGSNLSKMGSGEPRPALGGSVAAERLDLPWCPLSCLSSGPERMDTPFSAAGARLLPVSTCQPGMSFPVVCRAPWWQPALEHRAAGHPLSAVLARSRSLLRDSGLQAVKQQPWR